MHISSQCLCTCCPFDLEHTLLRIASALLAACHISELRGATSAKFSSSLCSISQLFIALFLIVYVLMSLICYLAACLIFHLYSSFTQDYSEALVASDRDCLMNEGHDECKSKETLSKSLQTFGMRWTLTIIHPTHYYVACWINHDSVSSSWIWLPAAFCKGRVLSLVYKLSIRNN